VDKLLVQVIDIDTAFADSEWQADKKQMIHIKKFLEAVAVAPIALVSHRDRDRLVPRHLIPSLAALPFLPERGKVLDIGSGGGFPGIPLAIARPDLHFTLVDSTRKKVDFLNGTIRTLSLTNTTALWARAEELSGEPKLAGAFNVVTARAVAKLPELLPTVKKLLAPKGKAILWKGKSWRREGNLERFGFSLREEKSLTDGSVLLLLSCAKQ
jgi:16S rRNA (guanine527-N7)-methyltransferase